jgi:hypothetical protein
MRLKEMYRDDREMLKLIGYDISAPFLGWTDKEKPMDHLFDPERRRKEDMY